MKVFLLDMGDQKYGDSIIIVDNRTKILIDGAHINDHKERESPPPLQEQIAEVLGQQPPFKFDLLVVTHCHGDHIGCLPALVGDGTIETQWALVADEDLGYPRTGGQDAGVDLVVDKVVAALREEPRTDFASDAEFERFLSDAMNLEQRYRQMVKTLERNGTRVIRFAGVDDEGSAAELRALKDAFAGVKLEIIGPTEGHLLRCTQAIDQFTQEARRVARSSRSHDSTLDARALYRLLTGMTRAADAAGSDDLSRFLDRPGKGAALNDQSIVLKFGEGPDAVLLTGDMQFAAAEIAGLDDLMSGLLRKTKERGPYAFVKLPHHASYNGFDETVAEAWEGTKVYGVTTGRGDADHPDSGVLELLKGMRSQVQWVRTDKNGIVEITLANGRVDMKKKRGRLSDPSPNREDALPPPERQELVEKEAITSKVSTVQTRSAGGDVEVLARIPHTATRVVITVEVTPGAGDASIQAKHDLLAPERGREARPPPDGPRLAAGRKLPPLLFVTRLEKLGANIGATEAQRVQRLVAEAGQTLLDVRGPDPFPEIRKGLAKGDKKGVVIIGGYDVLMPLRYDVLPPTLRTAVQDNGDPDDFIVWSDQAYSDVDGDMLGELPVSRIPDGRLATLVINALCAPSAAPRVQSFGLRNYARPFANGIFSAIGDDMMVSEPTRSRNVQAGAVNANSVYVMLHGSDADCTRFWGESARGGSVEALNVGNIPNPCGGIVFSGCCWGALASRTTAVRYKPGDPVQSLTPEQSLALSFLHMGAQAFVGCTGAHYSPIQNETEHGFNYFGAPLHRSFWSRVLQSGEQPAQALFGAKMDYIRDMPHGRRSRDEQAIEYKILRQFTCLGLGW
jgi:beta-lactamase superfamily II metal-dependent hydrolase